MSLIFMQSRSRQEDPEQLRLKQKAKEVCVQRAASEWPLLPRLSLPGIVMGLSVGIIPVSPLVFQMQQQELAQIRQREANLTALAAIGPRKKRKMDSPVRGASAEVRNLWPFATEELCVMVWTHCYCFFPLLLFLLWTFFDC